MMQIEKKNLNESVVLPFVLLLTSMDGNPEGVLSVSYTVRVASADTASPTPFSAIHS